MKNYWTDIEIDAPQGNSGQSYEKSSRSCTCDFYRDREQYLGWNASFRHTPTIQVDTATTLEFV